MLQSGPLNTRLLEPNDNKNKKKEKGRNTLSLSGNYAIKYNCRTFMANLAFIAAKCTKCGQEKQTPATQ